MNKICVSKLNWLDMLDRIFIVEPFMPSNVYTNLNLLCEAHPK